MSELEQSALAVYFANCQGIKSDPLPMLRKILALREGDRRDAERYRWLRDSADPDSGDVYATRHLQNGWGKWSNTVEQGSGLDAAIDTAIATLRGEGSP